MSDLDNLPGRAAEHVRKVERCWHKMVAATKPSGHEVALFIGTPFGVHRASWLFPMGSSTIMVSVVSGETMFLPVEQCAFRLQIFKPTRNKPRVIVGFAPPPKDKDAV